MSVSDIGEWIIMGFLLILYLLHIAVMVMAHMRNGGLRNRKLLTYSVVSILPLIISASFLIFGPDDISGRLDIFHNAWLIIGYLAVSFL